MAVEGKDRTFVVWVVDFYTRHGRCVARCARNLCSTSPQIFTVRAQQVRGALCSDAEHVTTELLVEKYACAEPSLLGGGLAVFSGAAAQLPRSRICGKLFEQ